MASWPRVFPACGAVWIFYRGGAHGSGEVRFLSFVFILFCVLNGKNDHKLKGVKSSVCLNEWHPFFCFMLKLSPFSPAEVLPGGVRGPSGEARC